MKMDSLNWGDEPDLDQLRELHAKLDTNPEDALPGLERLGERGSLASALYLAEFYMKNRVSADTELNKTKYWYSKAHAKGHPQASYMLGTIYSQSGDYKAACLAFSRGAEQGYAPAIYRLAKLYQAGEGVPKNIAEYKRLLEIARSKGHVFAKRDLATVLLTGQFGIMPAVRGAIMLLTLWFDVAHLIWKAVRPGSTFDDRILA
jgi:TPR repeat protein